MHIRYSRIEAPAKLNIRLKITGRRRDGYHELVSIMIPVSLTDQIEVRERGSQGIELAVSGLSVPLDESNLVIRAASSFLSRTGLQTGLSIKMIKNIPVAAGMGGGSSDAAATLLTINRMFSSPLSMGDLHEVALQLGADVPFFLRCEPSLATGIGENLEPIEPWPEFWYVIVAPPIQVSTAWVYQHYKMRLTTGEYASIKKTLGRSPFAISQILENDLESVTSASFPIIDTIKRQLMENGAEGALMSGSGPSVFGVFTSQEKAEVTRSRLASRNLGDVFIATEYRRENTEDRSQESEVRSQKTEERRRKKLNSSERLIGKKSMTES